MNILKTKKFKVAEFDDSALIERLRKSPKELESYIDYICDEYSKDQNLEALLESLKVAVMAKRGTATKIAKNGKLKRTSIYRALSPKSNPRIETLQEIVQALGRCLMIGKANEISYRHKMA
jgi:probable addiction module antidote protein